MNQKRVWPGVPNRYRIRSRSMLIRPKSMATVVVIFPGTCRLSSTPTPAEVMMASVVSGVISETEPTSVVLPTPNPPAITIFADVTRPAEGRCDMSEPAKSTQHPFQQFRAYRVGLVVQRGGLVHRDKAISGHVGDDHSSHTERQLHACGDLRQRLNSAAVAHLRDVLMLASTLSAAHDAGSAAYGCLDQRFQRYLKLWPGPTAGYGVRPDQRAGRLIAFGHRHRSPLPRTLRSVCVLTVLDSRRVDQHPADQSGKPRWLSRPTARSAENPGGGPRGRGKRLADPVDEEGHLVTDLPDVTAARREDRERRTVGDRHQEEEPVVHLD